MARRIDAHDWAATPLGAMAGWPVGLRVVTRLLLNTRHPMLLFWGPALIQLYNDAHRDTMGPDEHPSALGRPAHETWAGIWDTIGPRIGQVMAGGPATRHEDQPVPVTRHGGRRNVWWTYSFSPVDDGETSIRVAGVLVICRDMSERHHARRIASETVVHQAFLLRLSDALRPLGDAEEIQATASRLLAGHLGADRAACSGIGSGAGGGWASWSPVQGAAVVVHDAGHDPRPPEDVRAAWREAGVGALVVVVLVEDGRERMTVSVVQNRPRHWSREEIDLVRDVADRTWSAIERARAEAALRRSEERLRQFGEASQDVLWIRDAGTLQWQYLTPAFETIYGLSRTEALAGENYATWLDLIVPEDRRHAMDNIGRVRQGEHVTFEFRIRRPVDGAIRWMRDSDFPIFDDTGAVVLIGGIGHDATRLRAAEQGLQMLLDGIPQLVWRAAPGGLWTWSSPQWTAYTGLAEARSLGRGWLQAIHPEDRAGAEAAWVQAEAPGRLDVEYRLADAGGRFRWFRARATSVRDEDGRIAEWLGTSTDVDDLRRMGEEQAAMVAELQHRTRNLITVIRSIATETARSGGTVADFRTVFNDRLGALSRVQGLLSRSGRLPVTLGALLRMEFDALGAGVDGDRLHLDGPEIALRKSTVQTLALALHELATNARRHGALAGAEGRLHVTWTVRHVPGEGERLLLDWREDGPPRPDRSEDPGGPDPAGVRPATGGDFGRTLIEQALPYTLDARTSYRLDSAGLHCTIDLPLAGAASDADPSSGRTGHE